MARPRRSAPRPTSHGYPRTARHSETLREVIAEELVRIDDERLDLVTITRVDTDPEMNRAAVYFDSLAGEQGDAEIVEALGQHRKRLQGAIGRQIRAKNTPILSFAADDVIRSAERIEGILRQRDTLPAREDEDLSDRYDLGPRHRDAEPDDELDGLDELDDLDGLDDLDDGSDGSDGSDGDTDRTA